MVHSFSEWVLLRETRFKGLMRQFRQEHPTMPRYVQNDLYSNRVGYAFGKLLGQQQAQAPTAGMDSIQTKPTSSRGNLPSTVMKLAGMKNIQWSQQSEPLQGSSGQGVTPADFTKKTVNYFVHRKFGIRVEKQIRNDAERMTKQKEIMMKRGQGGNEPVIVIQTKEGFELLEGWHRTMNYLMSGCPADQLEMIKTGQFQEVDFSKWTPVQVNAFVGRGPEMSPQSLAGTGDYQASTLAAALPGTGDYAA